MSGQGPHKHTFRKLSLPIDYCNASRLCSFCMVLSLINLISICILLTIEYFLVPISQCYSVNNFSNIIRWSFLLEWVVLDIPLSSNTLPLNWHVIRGHICHPVSCPSTVTVVCFNLLLTNNTIISLDNQPSVKQKWLN
jgi:hypothetical protein